MDRPLPDGGPCYFCGLWLHFSTRQWRRTNPGTRRRRDKAAQIERGSQAFIANGCGWCHANGGRKEGRCPQLMDDAHDDNFLMTRIATGSPGRMPAFGQSLQIEDIQAIIAYIRNLKP